MADSAVVTVRTGGAVKQLRNVKRPRPLKMSPSQLDEILEQVQQMEAAFREKLYEPDGESIGRISKLLKENGAALECYNKEAMNRLDTALRVACRDPELDLVTRLHVLELVELRQAGWILHENILNYYRQKLLQVEQELNNLDMESSFTGNHYESMVTQPSTPNMSGDYAFFNNNNNLSTPNGESNRVTTIVVVGGSELFISGTSEALVNSAKEVLEDFYSLCKKNTDEVEPQWMKLAGRPEISYERDDLLQMAKSPLCGRPPAAWEEIAASYPSIVKREGPSSKHFLREMASLRKQEAAKIM